MKLPCNNLCVAFGKAFKRSVNNVSFGVHCSALCGEGLYPVVPVIALMTSGLIKYNCSILLQPYCSPRIF